jgi:DNA-binding CsgD family transcriptional regulator
MAKMRASSKEDAMKIARYVGCSGAHQDKKGNWIPCANPEDLVEILDKSARNSTEKLTKKKRRRFVNGQWERLGERGPISIDTIDGGGLVSGMGKSLTEWFKEEWVDISRPKKGGGFEPCGRDDADKGKYPKCVPGSRASKMSEEEIRSAVSRKRRAESTQSRDDKKPIYVPTDKKNDSFVLDEKSATPTNPELYARVKAEAKKKFDVYPSAYANAWLVREYKKRGGGYRSEKADDGDYEDFVEDLTEMQLSDFIDWVDQKEKAEKVCPPATSDIGLNIKNRQNAINTAGYGPLNPKEPNVDFWEKKAKRWSVTIEESKKQKCGNCAVFIKTPRILECIESGLGNEAGDTAWDAINAGDLGYCEAFDFKCASARTCDAWVGGGPVTVEKGKQEEKAETSTIIIGRAKPRIGDPDVYTDPNSARLRSRKLGCIGIARRETPDGEVVWTPCTNISDQRRYQGETPLGQRDEARRFADRLAEVGGPDRKRRRMRKYKSLEFATDIKAFRTLGSSMNSRGISGNCRQFTGIDGDGDGFVCNPATREDDLPLTDTRKIFKRGGKMLSREELVEQDETMLNMFAKGEPLSRIAEEVGLDKREVEFLIKNFRKQQPKVAFTIFNNRDINIQKKREERRKLGLESIRREVNANRKLNARGEEPTPESDDDLDFTLDPDKVPQYLKKNFAKYMQRLKDPEFADEIKKIADDLRAGLGLAGTAKKYKRDSAFIEIVRRNEKITKTKKLQKNIRESEVPDFNNDTDDPDFTLDPEKIPQFLKRGFAGNVRLARSPEFAEERKKIADDLLLGLGIAAVRLKYNRDTSLVDVVRRLEKIPKSKELKKVDPKIRQDVVDLVDKLIKDDNPFMSVAEIAKEFKITGIDARRIINAAKLEKYFDLHNKYTDAKRKKLFAEVAELHKLDLTYEEIGKRLGISGDAVNHIVKKMKLPLRRPGGGGGLPGVIKRGGVMIPRSLAMKQNKEMLDLYQRGYSLTDIAKEMGIGVATVREIIKKFADNDKVRIRGNNVTEKENQIRKLLKEGLHPREIMRDIIGNVTYSRILEIAKEEDIKIPPMRKFKSDNQNFNSFENDDYFY